MPQKLQLSISQPCHENWQQMNPTEQGKFCKACAKEVVDFTSMSDTEVLHYFIKGKKENVCGRLFTDQLNRPIEQPFYTAKKISWYWNYVVMIFLLLFRGNPARAQVQVRPVSIERASNINIDTRSILGGITVGVQVKSTIEGIVTDETGRAVAGATVQLKGKNKATVTDANGKYHLGDVAENEFLQISAIGYCSKDVKASRSENQVSILKMAVMGDVVVTVGFIDTDYNYTAPAKPMHVAVIEIRDGATRQSLKAKITIYNDDRADKVTVNTSKDGVYKLRRIGEQESYRVTVSAKGYKESVLNIDGWKFNERKETRPIFLKPDDAPAPQQRQIRMGGISSNLKEPLYIIDGNLATAKMIKDIKPEEVEEIHVLKDTSAIALYGRPAAAGVIIITTKKQPVKKFLVDAITNKTETTVGTEKTVLRRLENFTIAPNPVEKGTSVTVSFNSTVAGEYSLRILNTSGALVQSKKITITQKFNQLQLQTNDSWESGVYYISIGGEKSIPVQAGRFVIK